MPSTAETHTGGDAVLGKPGGSPARRHSRNGRWTHECCFEVDVFVRSGLRKLMVIITEDLSFFLVWVSQTKSNYRTKLMM